LTFVFSSLTAPAPSGIYTLSLHDALPIFPRHDGGNGPRSRLRALWSWCLPCGFTNHGQAGCSSPSPQWCRSCLARRFIGVHSRRSEEHTSELQSRENLVCRLLLEKKKKRK